MYASEQSLKSVCARTRAQLRGNTALQKNGYDGQLSHAIKAFYGVNWSFAAE